MGEKKVKRNAFSKAQFILKRALIPSLLPPPLQPAPAVAEVENDVARYGGDAWMVGS